MAAAAASIGLACSSQDGRTLPAPSPDRTTTSVSAPVVVQPSDEGALVEIFSLTSDAFVDGGEIPLRYTCAGENVSPPLAWASTPPAVELALVVRDESAAGYVHWVVTGIDPAVQGLGEGGLPEGAVEATNDGGTIGWTGPCPPAGTTHTYLVSIHALATPVAVSPGLAPAEAARLVEAASSARADLRGIASG